MPGIRIPKSRAVIDNKEVRRAIARLRDIPQALRDKVLKKILRSSAKPLIASAKRKVPVDTGALKKSIGIVPKIRKGGIIVIGPINKKGGGFGAMVELGIPSRPNYPAQPYMRPAAMETEDQVVQKIFEGVEDALKQFTR